MATMAELVATLQAMPRIYNVEPPVLQGGAEASPDPHGFYLYNIPVLEIQGNVGHVRQVGVKGNTNDGASPVAFFLGMEPPPASRTSSFLNWMLGAYTASPGSYKGLIVHRVDEVAETAIVSYLQGSPLERGFFFVENGGVPEAIQNFDIRALDYDVPIDRCALRDE